MKKEIHLVLDNIRSRENVGSIFRTADAAGVSRIYLCGITPCPTIDYSQLTMDKIHKTALGADPVVENQAASLKENLIYTTGQGSDKISKTALGAENYVPWEYHKQTWRCLKQLRDNELWLIALEKTKSSKNIFELKSLSSRPLAFVVGPAPESPKATRCGTSPEPNFVLVLGNEVRGLSPKILKYCDEVVHIPMYGRKESLNVSVAAGIAVYQILNSKS